MAGLMRREPRGQVGEFFGRFDRMLDEWAKMMPFRAMSFPRWHDVDDLIRDPGSRMARRPSVAEDARRRHPLRARHRGRRGTHVACYVVVLWMLAEASRSAVRSSPELISESNSRA